MQNVLNVAIGRQKLGKCRLVLLMSQLRVFISVLSAGILGVNTNSALEKLKSGKLKILVKPNAKKSEILGWDAAKQRLRVAIAAPAEGNKANIAIVKFFSKLIGKRIRIKSGLKSKEKIIST